MESPLRYFVGPQGPQIKRSQEMERHGGIGPRQADWLKDFLRLPGDIPGHDTFNRVFLPLASICRCTVR